MATVILKVNGARREFRAAPSMPLLWALRELAGLKGTKYGCGVGVCGACTILVDGKAARACITTLRDAAGRSVVTIEGLSSDATHPVQQAWLEEDVAQCGYCQPAQILSAVALLDENPAPSDAEIDQVMSEVVCRCGTYLRIRNAVHRAAGGMKR